MPITIDDKNDAAQNLRRLTWFENHTHVPHWKRPGQCDDTRAIMTVMSNVLGPWLSFDTQEFADKSSKRTMVSLTEEDARRLYAWMKSIYEPKASLVLTQLAAVEFGYRQCERGNNLQMALKTAVEVLK